MNDLLAKGVAATVAVLLLAVVGILVFTSRPSSGAEQVVAEFDDAFPLIEGMHVRVDGAIAGSVGTIEVNDRGNAEVSLVLNDSVEQPMADATAAIRQQDTTGDSYVAFDPGGDPEDPLGSEPLGEDGIVCEGFDECGSTLVAPRLDDLLNAFGPAERTGLQLILVEIAKALDRRGDDLNDAALALRPAFESANQALAEVNQQNDALKQLISSAESVSGQAARRDAELAHLIDSLSTTVETTAGESAALDAGLQRLPATATQARTTLAALSGAASAARPLAEQVAVGAPRIATALDRAPGFLDNLDGFLTDTRPTLDLTRRLLRDAEPTLRVGKERVITGPFDLTGATADLLNAVLGGEDAFPALFGDDSYGEGQGTLGKRGFGAVAVEPGNLPGYPAEHEPRNWLRVSAVINCEVFGAPIEPGCLADVLSGATPLPVSARGDSRIDSAVEGRAGLGGAQGGGDQDAGQPQAPSGGGGKGGDVVPPSVEIPNLPELKLPGLGKDLLGPRLGKLGRGLDRLGLRKGGRDLRGLKGSRGVRGARGSGPRLEPGIADLFDFLTGNDHG